MKSDLYPTEAIHMFAVLITWTSIIAGICFKSQKSIFNRRLLLLAIIIIGGYGFRLFVWQTGESSYYDYSYLFYCFLPLSVSLLVESAIKRPVSLFTKIVVSFTPLILISGIISRLVFCFVFLSERSTRFMECKRVFLLCVHPFRGPPRVGCATIQKTSVFLAHLASG